MNRLYGQNFGNKNAFTAFIRDNNNKITINFPVMPEGINESISASFSQQEIIGASRPRIVYSNTSAKTINMSLQNLTEDYIVNGFSDLNSYVKALQSLVYPTYGSGGIAISPNLTLVLGKRSISCVCTNVSVSWGNIVSQENTIMSCNVDLAFLVTRNTVPGAFEIMNEINEI